MKTLGVDLSAQNAGTAACILSWDGSGLRLERLSVGVSDTEIIELHRTVDTTAVDAPFGWPDGFVRAVAGFSNGQAWPDIDSVELWARLTDVRTHELALGPPPLSVSSDRIARTAARAARLLTLLGDHRPVARDGLDGVIEVYPAAAIRLWGLAARGYKHRLPATARPIRERLLMEILGRLRLQLHEDSRTMLAMSHDATDAFVASLVARAFFLGYAVGPQTEAEWRAARREGWIWLPNRPLEDLTAPAPTEQAIQRDRRGLPHQLRGLVGEPITLALPWPPPRHRWLILAPDQITVDIRNTDNGVHVELLAEEAPVLDPYFRLAVVLAPDESETEGERFDISVFVEPMP